MIILTSLLISVLIYMAGFSLAYRLWPILMSRGDMSEMDYKGYRLLFSVFWIVSLTYVCIDQVVAYLLKRI